MYEDTVYDTPIEIENHAQPAWSVIWLHGLGADGNDFVPVVDMLKLPLRFILPHAPYQQVTLNNGQEMRAWYDLFGLSANSEQDDAGIRQSQNHIETLIEKEIAKGVPSHQIFLAGFSQGGAVALQTALRYQKPLAGVLALSTYLPLHASFDAEKSQQNQNTPIFMAHGTEDEVITLSTYQLSAKFLESEQYSVEKHEYPMGHSVCSQEIDDIRAFFLGIVN